MNKKIVLVITGLGVGGAEVSLQKLVLGMRLPASNLKIVSLTTIGEIGEELINNGYDVEALNLSSVSTLPKAFRRLHRIIADFGPDIVHTWLYHADLIGGLAARLAGCKNVIWGVRSTKLRRGSYLTGIVRRVNALLSYILPKKIVYVAKSSQEMHERLGYNKAISNVIPNGCDADKFSFSNQDRENMRNELGLQHNEILLGCVGRFSQVKGQDILIRAFGRSKLTHSSIKLLLIGRGMEDSNRELASLLASAGVVNRTILVGETSNVAKYLSSLDIYCLPSRGEGFPNALVEAMAVGLPCVASDVGDVSEVMKGYGIVVSPDNVTAMEDGIRQMIDMSSEQRLMLGRKGRGNIQSSYSIHSMIDRYLRVYSS